MTCCLLRLPTAINNNNKKRFGGACAPPYPHKHSGPVLVLGNAYCLDDDYKRAREIFPDAPVIAVNGASAYTKAFALFTLHAAKFPKWIEAQRKFGDDFTTHSAGTPRDRTQLGKLKEYKPWVDYWWQYGCGGGTSTWGARRIAKYMGFDLVVLCGMPLCRGGYSNGLMARHFMKDPVIEHYRSQVLLDEHFHEGVVSMSGWTREVFGSPD